MAIHDLLKRRKDEEVMLCRFDHVTIRGVHSNAGWIELDRKTPKEAATLILERLALNGGYPKNHYMAISSSPQPPRTSIPNNLPRLQPFFGRENELAAIRGALDPENRTWGALIDGPGGMGKTSLAVRAAYDCSPRQFHRIIFLSVKDREMDDDGVRRFTGFLLPGFLEMLNELARKLGKPDITKATEEQRIRLLLDALRPAKALLILDNLESLPKSDRDQIFTFVKRLPQGCKAILTSRRRIGSGSEEIILEQFDESAALRFLRTCSPDNDPLEFIFGDLVGEFTPEETRVLCALNYFTLPVKSEHTAEVAGLEKEPVETALRSLANRSLVVPDQEEQSFAPVPMIAEFLQRKRPEVVVETGDRLENRAYALIIENGYRELDRFPVLDAAWPTVVPALPLLRSGSNDRFQTACDALVSFLEFTGHWDEMHSLNQQAETKAVAASDYYNAGKRAFQTGYVHALRNQPEEVLNCAERAEAHLQKANAGAHERARVIRLRGNGHALKNDYSAAISAYCESLRMARALGYAEMVAGETGNLALLALDRKDWPGAETLAREALSLCEKLGRQELITSDCWRLAMALAKQGKKAEGLPYARRAMNIFIQLGSPKLKHARGTLRMCGG